MFAMLNGNRILNVPIWIWREVLGPVKGGTDYRRAAIPKARDNNARQTASQRIRYACVEAICGRGTVHIDIDKVKRCPVVAKPRFVYDIGVGGVYPASGDRCSANRRVVRCQLVHERVIFSSRIVVAIEEHSVEGILIVHMVIEFPHSIVAGIDRRERAEETV